jgi:hypothetical protein
VVRHVEEDVRAEVLVAVRLTGIDRRNVDVNGDVRLLGSVGELDDTVEGTEAAPDLGEAEVAPIPTSRSRALSFGAFRPEGGVRSVRAIGAL